MRPLIAGNWKMYKSASEVRFFCEEIQKKIGQLSVDLAIFPQAVHLPLFSTIFTATKQNHFFWGPQNIHYKEMGAFTGELSPLAAKEFGSEMVIIGHSERRQFFGETNTSAAERALGAITFGLQPIFCVGETLEEREANRTMEVIDQQLAPLFSLVKEPSSSFSIAYEPVWAIGTGKTATALQAQEVQQQIRKRIESSWGKENAAKCRILYGGSVKPENAKEILSQPDVDGALVGGASLEVGSFLSIAAAANQ
ncbi:MAG: triose-phosphate isomerase [Oligoflexia bacterium]|nr:triose-phosphate isomerase [Oligoflexia bacterium]